MRWRLFAGIASVFVLGGIAGGVVGIAAERERMRRMEKEAPTLVLDALAKRMENELKLEPNQVTRLKEVYAGTRGQLIQMEKERRRRLRAMMESTQTPILEILNPAQRVRYQQLQHQLQQRLRLRDSGKAVEFPDKPTLPVAPRT